METERSRSAELFSSSSSRSSSCGPIYLLILQSRRPLFYDSTPFHWTESGNLHSLGGTVKRERKVAIIVDSESIRWIINIRAPAKMDPMQMDLSSALVVPLGARPRLALVHSAAPIPFPGAASLALEVGGLERTAEIFARLQYKPEAHALEGARPIIADWALLFRGGSGGPLTCCIACIRKDAHLIDLVLVPPPSVARGRLSSSGI